MIANGVQLITYADRFGGTLKRSADTVARVFGDAVTGIHFLPFFTPYDGADAGFDPVDHTTPDPRLGTWEDLREISGSFSTCVDVIVNHVSSGSASFRDFVEHGEDSPAAELFLTFDRVFPDGATEADLLTIYRPRPGLPFTTIPIAGANRLVWTTFTPQQIDIDVESPSGWSYLMGILDQLGHSGVGLIRLDAAGYAIKRAGTSCFMIPETFAFIDRFTAEAHHRGLEVLVEIHSHYRTQIEIASRVDRVYDFALPPLLLHTLYTGDHGALLEWLRVRPANAVTVLDTHDGIGVIDVGPDKTRDDGAGLLTAAELDALVATIHAKTNGQSREATGAAASNLDLYQVNSTYYDALGRDDARYLAARAVQFFLPGVPQVYYVGALAGPNDMGLLQRTGVGRDINRHVFTEDEIDAAMERPVVAALKALMRLRSRHPAFGGDFSWSEVDGSLRLAWEAAGDRAWLTFTATTGAAQVGWTEHGADGAATEREVGVEGLAEPGAGYESGA
ncbi:sucrose phosphorylase [Tessaracoccus sp. G1721]